ncbi:hypothetical protein AB840_15360 [Megasphaera cerevisiae DSM 20462]|uniref:Uncharacterized protein n=1 Tax=Megasphaera cerevisiae DSM 20462 TaxID=1122219 RepID=A0A0J6WRK7_9FIRM|nr:hypothetical protein AB840_15360 [Megasphaera cerevisiae DSM 20462]
MLLCRSIVQKLLNMRVSIGTIIIRILKAMQTIAQILFLNHSYDFNMAWWKDYLGRTSGSS